MLDEVKAAFAEIQRLLRTNFDFIFEEDAERDDGVLLELDRSGRGIDDKACFEVKFMPRTHAAVDGPLLASAMHELIHCIYWEPREIGYLRLREAERERLRTTDENATYQMERAFWPFVSYWKLPMWRRILRAIAGSPGG